MMGHHPIMTRGMMGGSKGMMSDQMSSYPAITDAKTALHDVGDRRIDFQGPADRLAALRTQIVVVEAAKRGP